MSSLKPCEKRSRKKKECQHFGRFSDLLTSYLHDSNNIFVYRPYSFVFCLQIDIFLQVVALTAPVKTAPFVTISTGHVSVHQGGLVTTVTLHVTLAITVTTVYWNANVRMEGFVTLKQVGSHWIPLIAER